MYSGQYVPWAICTPGETCTYLGNMYSGQYGCKGVSKHVQGMAFMYAGTLSDMRSWIFVIQHIFFLV